jgi:hypothetical protein
MKHPICLSIWILYSILSSFAQEKQVPDSLQPHVKLLLTVKELDIRDKPLFIANGRLLTWVEGVLVAIPTNEQDILQIASLPKITNNPEKVIFIPYSHIFFKVDIYIKQIEDSTAGVFLKMPTSNFTIYPANPTKIYIQLQENKKTILYLVDIETKDQVKLLSHTETITDVLGDGERAFVAIGKDIFLLEDEKMTQIHRHKTDIVAITGSDYGLFFAGKAGIEYLSLPYLAVPAVKGNFVQLLYSNNTLYGYTIDGDLFMIEHANNFEYKIREFFKE